MNLELNPNSQPPGRFSGKNRWGRALKRLVIYIAGFYVLILVLLVSNETYLVYPGSKFPRGNWEPKGFPFEEIQFLSTDQTKLVGWYLPRPDGEPSGRTILLCHGNAENVAQSSAYVGRYMRQVLKADVFVFDYRGYGKSQGTPDEPGVLADADSALEWLCERTGKKPSEIIIVGHSIGGGPAVHLASQSGCKALILQRTFSSLADAAQYQYPWLPVRYLISNVYPSTEKIKNCSVPLFQSHGGADTLIPIKLARKLFESSPAKNKRFLEYPQMGHLDPLPTEYWQKLREFVEAVDRNSMLK